METERLKHFEVVARTLHFGRAADILGIDQSILSRSIKRLEEEVGAQLLDRSRRHVVLSPAGRAFLDEARAAMRAVERAARVARTTGADHVGDLNLAVA